MIYRKDEISGNNLSQLGFGCMRLTRSAFGINMAKAEEIIKYAYEQGVNFFDTAYMYSGSEEALGTIINKLGIRDKVYLTSKLPWITAKKESDLDRYLNESLSRLSTSYIDYYFMHMLTDYTAWEKLLSWGVIDKIEEWKKAGKIRAIGFSFHGSYSDYMKILNAYDWDITLIQYNYSDPNFQAGVKGLRAANKRKIPVVIMEPLLGGRLANALPEKAAAEFKRAKTNPVKTPAEWAFDWIWNQPEPTVVLSGMSSMEMVRENIISASRAEPGCLSDKDLAVIETVRKIWNESNKINCTGCGYCMPCPGGVNIPGCFASFNTSYSHGRVAGIRSYFMSTSLINNPQIASKCMKCGKCEKVCPQKLPIMSNLTEVKKRLEPFPVMAAMVIARKITKKD
ncbi:MAG: aldo/keto reductase [Ruminococcus sp.]|jgi:predicted aldo/keto reductase-like oxidoreductase|nr:aldo/keto reductase [Ruminococcus sp.]